MGAKEKVSFDWNKWQVEAEVEWFGRYIRATWDSPEEWPFAEFHRVVEAYDTDTGETHQGIQWYKALDTFARAEISLAAEDSAHASAGL
jgi:hypothetical protein